MKTLENQKYNFKRKLFWRFIFLYIILYIFPYGFEYINELNPEDISFWKGITIWFGQTFLGWEFYINNLQNGFDSKYDYSRFLLIVCISTIGSVIWLFIDSKIKYSYTHKLKVLLQTILRYHIGLTLILYGLAKVFLLQFGSLDINDLETNLGNQSGMGFLWKFMSYSDFYSISTGLIEVTGGVLVLFRRTTFIGAFILFIAMVNVVLVDIGYDVSVKMFAIHLLLMTVLLIFDNLKQLINFFITNKPTIPYNFAPFFNSKKIRYGLKGIILIYFIISFRNSFKERIRTEKSPNNIEMTGIYEIDIFIKNRDTINSSNSDRLRWETMRLNCNKYYPKHVAIKNSDGQTQWFKFEENVLDKTITFKPIENASESEYLFNYKKTGKNKFTFSGIYKGDTLSFSAKSKMIKDYLLTKNETQWIRDLE